MIAVTRACEHVTACMYWLVVGYEPVGMNVINVDAIVLPVATSKQEGE